jgi:hypothetical protein
LGPGFEVISNFFAKLFIGDISYSNGDSSLVKSAASYKTFFSLLLNKLERLNL